MAERSNIDAAVAVAGGYDSELTAYAALDDLSRLLREYHALGGTDTWPRLATADAARLRLISFQQDLSAARRAAAERSSRPPPSHHHAHGAGGPGSAHAGGPGLGANPLARHAPDGSTEVLDSSVVAGDAGLFVAQREVVAPLADEAYVMARWANRSHFEALGVLEAANVLTSQPSPHGQAAHALIFGACKSNRKMYARVAADVVSTAADVLAWVDQLAVACLGGIAARSAGGMQLRLAAKEGAVNFDLKATTITRIWAATPSVNTRQATHLASHDGQLGDPASFKEVHAAVKCFERDVLQPLWGGPGQIAMLPAPDRPSLGAFGLVGLTTACQAVGLGPAKIITVLDAAFEEIRDAAAERRRSKHARVADVVEIVRAKQRTYIDDAARGLAARAETRDELRQMGFASLFADPPGRAASPGMPFLPLQPWDEPRALSPLTALQYDAQAERRLGDARSDGRGYSGVDAFHPAQSRAGSALRPTPRREDSRRSASRERSRSRDRDSPRFSRARDSMPANRDRLLPADRDPDRDRQRDHLRDYDRRGDGDDRADASRRSPGRQQRGADDARGPDAAHGRDDRSRDRDRRQLSRERRDGDRERSSSRGRSEGGDAPRISSHGELGRAFRARASALGLPQTCVFNACFQGGCSKAGCRDCSDLPAFDRAKHGALVGEMRARLTDTYAATLRWRDAG